MELIKFMVRGVRRSKRGKKCLKCELEGWWMLHRYRGAVGDLAKPVAKPDPITPCQSAPQRAHAKLRRLPISARHPHACGRGRVLLCGFFCLHNRKPPSPQRAHALIHASPTGYSAERAQQNNLCHTTLFTHSMQRPSPVLLQNRLCPRIAPHPQLTASPSPLSIPPPLLF